MKVYQVPVGPMQNFCYVVEDESTQECIVIDPSWDLDNIIQIIEEQNLNPKYIVNTHWHAVSYTHLTLPTICSV